MTQVKFFPFPNCSVVDETVSCLISDKLVDRQVLGEVCEFFCSMFTHYNNVDSLCVEDKVLKSTGKWLVKINKCVMFLSVRCASSLCRCLHCAWRIRLYHVIHFIPSMLVSPCVVFRWSL